MYLHAFLFVLGKLILRFELFFEIVFKNLYPPAKTNETTNLQTAQPATLLGRFGLRFRRFPYSPTHPLPAEPTTHARTPMWEDAKHDMLSFSYGSEVFNIGRSMLSL